MTGNTGRKENQRYSKISTKKARIAGQHHLKYFTISEPVSNTIFGAFGVLISVLESFNS
jgi:hypothetical protein